jgi:hypothetical protein
MEKFEQISSADTVSDLEKKAFLEMQNSVNDQKDKISEDLFLPADLEEVMKKLTAREREIITKRFFYGETLKEVGDYEGVGKERIRQIEAKALRKMRHPLNSKLIKDVDLQNRDGSTYWRRLEDLAINNSRNFGENKELDKILRDISFPYLWTRQDEISKLDSSFFNRIYDEIKRILTKTELNKEDLKNLAKVIEEFKGELYKIKMSELEITDNI